MFDAALIQQCADPSLEPAIVEQFIARAGSQDPLTINVRSGSRVVLVPKPTTPEEALALIRGNLGRNMVRVGITQYPAGLGIFEAGQLKPDIVDACENIRMGTALFAKVYQIVTKWYGDSKVEGGLPQVMDDAITAWQTGYFEGVAVFRVEEPRQQVDSIPTKVHGLRGSGNEKMKEGPEESSQGDFASDPNTAAIRIDLDSINGGKKLGYAFPKHQIATPPTAERSSDDIQPYQ